MARRTGRDAIYDAADTFRVRCLTGRKSLLWPDRVVWTPETIDRLIAAYIDRPDETSRPFLDKWHDQLLDQPDDVHRLAADVLAFYYLFPTNVGANTKLQRIKTLLNWRLQDDQPDLALIEAAFAATGLGSPGMFYLTTQPFQIEYYLRFFRAIIDGDADPHDVSECRTIADATLQQHAARSPHPTRHIVLHLLFPEQFEPIASQSHKERIVATFANRAGGVKHIDDALLAIRHSFEASSGPSFDFYGDATIYAQWHPQPDVEAMTVRDPDLTPPRWWISKWDWSVPYGGGLQHEEAIYGRMLDEAGRDTYRALAEVSADDVILHIDTAQSAFIGFAWAAGSAVPSDAEFDARFPADRGPSRIIPTRGFTRLNPVLRFDDIFPSFRDRLIDLRNRERGLFYDATGRTSGLFFTTAPADLVDILDEAYQQVANITLTDLILGTQLQRVQHREDVASSLNLSADEAETIASLLAEKRQVIFEGPPGSGKTFVAEKIARSFTGNPLDGVPDESIEVVQFHQSYGYEDFVQGIRPETDAEGHLQYRVRPGIFMRLCERARLNPTKRFVILIDEINRGNISRIFGELLLLLEYRDQQVTLPYATPDEPKFSIPENVFLIGTMNTADRSLAQIDYALRRRFYFYRFQPVVDGHAPILVRWIDTQAGMPAESRERILSLFVALNLRITDLLGEDFQIGHSHFMRADIGTDDGLRRVWRYAVIPLLTEYFHSHRDRSAVLASFEIDTLLGVTAGGEEDDMAI